VEVLVIMPPPPPELKELELRSCNPRGPDTCDDAAALTKELGIIEKEIWSLQEQVKTGPKTPPSAVAVAQTEANAAVAPTQGSHTPTGWRQRVMVLEDELRQKSDVVVRLRQRELWFELQLKRQREVNGMPIDTLLNEVVALGEVLQVKPQSLQGNYGAQRSLPGHSMPGMAAYASSFKP